MRKKEALKQRKVSSRSFNRKTDKSRENAISVILPIYLQAVLIVIRGSKSSGLG